MFSKYKSFYKVIIILSITGLIMPSFGLTQETAGPPPTMESLKSTIWKAVKFLPEIVIKVIGEIFNWLTHIWNSYIYPFFHKIWLKIEPIFGQEVERRKPIIQQELKQETEEIKQEAPQVGQLIWEKIKNFFKFK